MPWIHQIPVAEATGLLKQEFDKALQRAGRVWHIVHIMSLNARALKASMELYGAAMHAPGPVPRYQREMLAVVVSRVNGCHY